MKMKKAVKLKARLKALSTAASGHAVDKQLLQTVFDNPRGSYQELEINVTSVKTQTPDELQITFVVKGEHEAAADFVAYTSAALTQLLSAAPARATLGNLEIGTLSEAK